MKNKQGLTIAALIIAIVGLSIGFAAFSNTLTISSSASINPDDSILNIVWSSSSSSAATSDIVPTLNQNNVTGFDADDAEIVSNGKTLSNLNVEFTAPGQSVTYSTNLYVYNAGQLQAQLTGIEFENTTNSNTYKKCVESGSNYIITPFGNDLAAYEFVGYGTVIRYAAPISAGLNLDSIKSNKVSQATCTIPNS